jgi:glycosyltransferase involved in cell wall biosynthesis
VDITYVLLVSKYSLVSCAFDFRGIELNDGITCASKIPQLTKYSTLIDLNRFYIFKNPAGHGFEYRSLKYNSILSSFIKREKFDIVHLTSVPSLFNIPMLSFRKKVLLTVHDPIPHSSSVSRMDRYNRFVAFKLYKYFLLLNEAQKEEFISYYGLGKNKIVLGSKLSSYNYLHLYNYNYSDKGRYILFFGNITPYKGLEFLFDAMSIVHEKYPDIKIIVAGRGDYYFDPQKYIKLGCFDIRNSFIADEELAKLVSECLFVVIPYTDATQSGVAMTAYAFNKPCIATNVGGLPEMVVDGLYGIIVPPRDSNSLANAMMELINNPDRIKLFSNNIFNDYQVGDKSWRKVAKDMLDNYKLIY